MTTVRFWYYFCLKLVIVTMSTLFPSIDVRFTSWSCCYGASFEMGAVIVKLENKTFEHWVRVGIAIGEKYLILWFFEIVGEAEGIVASHIGADIDWFCIFGIDVEIYRDIGLAILYFFASSTPSIIVAFGYMSNFHSIFKNWVIFLWNWQYERSPSLQFCSCSWRKTIKCISTC